MGVLWVCKCQTQDDYSKNNAPFSFGTLAQWAEKQDAKAFFVINIQVAFKDKNDIINFNLSRDLMTRIGCIWIFGLTPDADNRLSKTAYDFYSFIRVRAHFDDENVETRELIPDVSDVPHIDYYYRSYEEAEQQM
jgi:hypothetical protein